MKSYRIAATDEQIANFVSWCWEWYALEEVGSNDPSFRNMAEITWQLHDQLPDKEQN